MLGYNYNNTYHYGAYGATSVSGGYAGGFACNVVKSWQMGWLRKTI
jgi:hypothetical protein